MKMAFKSGKWIVSFREATLVCDIAQQNDRFIVAFDTCNKRVSLHTTNLDGIFKVLEKIYDRNSRTRHY